MKSFSNESYGDRVCRSIVEEILSDERRNWSTEMFRANVVTHCMVTNCKKKMRSTRDWIDIALHHIRSKDISCKLKAV